MKSMTRSTMGILLVSFLFVFSTSAAMAQDPVTANPDRYKVLLENDQVRVLEVHAKPGDKVRMHAHPNYVVYNLSGGKTRFTSAEGKTEEREAVEGNASWNESERHAAEIVGNTEAHSLLIELKSPRAKAKM